MTAQTLLKERFPAAAFNRGGKLRPVPGTRLLRYHGRGLPRKKTERAGKEW
ncbi:MAG: hypothetical protein PHF19_02235 [Synergistales bacterium]|nr:hypothetical protein [Synergistales bacterium]